MNWNLSKYLRVKYRSTEFKTLIHGKKWYNEYNIHVNDLQGNFEPKLALFLTRKAYAHIVISVNEATISDAVK
jgi:hypothetical protein